MRAERLPPILPSLFSGIMASGPASPAIKGVALFTTPPWAIFGKAYKTLNMPIKPPPPPPVIIVSAAAAAAAAARRFM